MAKEQDKINRNNTTEGKSQFYKNNKYYTISIYTIITITFLAVIVKLIWKWTSTIAAIESIFNMLAPFLIGMLIAYVLNPLVKLFDGKIFEKLFKMKNRNMRKGLSILISYMLVIGLLTVCISVVIPELYNSIYNVYNGINDYYNNFLTFLDKMAVKYPDLDIAYITKLAESNSTKVVEFLQNSIGTILPILYNTSISVISWILNLIIALMVSCYMLIDKEKLIRNFKRLIYVIMKKNTAERFISTLKDANEIFSNFVIGKALDSLIIGIICFIFMKIVGLEYAMLISVIVGITNMIPYFGPFIGAIPGSILLLTVNWKMAFVFIIWIVVLQQFDGLYLGPKILGDRLGLRPLWIIFAITVGGYFFGPIGMFLGVPTVAVIAYLLDRWITRVLIKKNIDI